MNEKSLTPLDFFFRNEWKIYQNKIQNAEQLWQLILKAADIIRKTQIFIIKSETIY